MAEIGLIASVIGVAGAGIKLSTTLYTFSETVATAADSIQAIAKDVSLTSAVLEELSSNLKHDEQARLYSGTALKTAQTVVRDCEVVFKQIDGALSKSMERVGALAGSGKRKGKGGKVVLSAIERLKWPFLQPKMQELRANLERLKSTLVLMLNVLTYARNVQTEKQRQPTKDDFQRLLIENLVAANQEATRNFQTLMRTIGPSGETNSMTETSTREHSVSEFTLVDQQEPSGLVQTMSAFNKNASLNNPSASEMSARELSHNIIAPEDDGSVSQFPLSGKASATETTMACLKRIQQALDQFEASEENLKSARQIAVSIEVYKHILHNDVEARKRKPWEIAYIKRREDGGLNNEPYDSTILSGGPLDAGSSQVGGHQSTAALQAQIDSTVGIMRDNINKVSLRGAKLGSLGGEGGSKSEVDRLLAHQGNADALIDGRPMVDNGFNPSTINESGGHAATAEQDQINDVVRVMRENINKVSQRGERLDELQDKTDNLSISAQGFRRSAYRARKQQGWLSTLGNTWNNLPSPRAALASADEFLQEKFAAAFYQEPPEAAVDISLPPPEVSGLGMPKSTPSESQFGLPQAAPVGKDHKEGPITPIHANAFTSYPDASRGKIVPVTVPSKNPAHQPLVSPISMSPPEISDMPEHASSSPPSSASDKIDAAPANDVEAENAATRIQGWKENMRSNRRGTWQGDEVLVSYTDQARPDVAPHDSRTSQNEASGAISEDDDGSVSGLDVSTEVEADGVPSLESLLREWTTLYD